ncbi:hypothetical protein EV363DRAFT_1137556, partial [Boletus edulis]
DDRKDQEGPSMVKARTAEVIERANGQRIYRMTEMIVRAQAWSRQGGPRVIKGGPYFRELLYGSINHDEALTRPRLIYTKDLEGAFARSPRLTNSEGRALTRYEWPKYGCQGKHGQSNHTSPRQDDLQDD